MEDIATKSADRDTNLLPVIEELDVLISVKELSMAINSLDYEKVLRNNSIALVDKRALPTIYTNTFCRADKRKESFP